MTVLIIIIGVIVVLFVIGRILAKLTEVILDAAVKRSVRKQEKQVNDRIRKAQRKHEREISPFVQKYSNSEFLAQIVSRILSETSGHQITGISIYNVSLSYSALKNDKDGLIPLENLIHLEGEIKYVELGYQPISGDDYLEAFAVALNQKLGDNYRLSLNHADLIGAPLESISLSPKEGVIKLHKEPDKKLKPTI